VSARARLRTRIAGVVAAGALVVAIVVALLLTNTVTLRRDAEATTRSDNQLLRVVEVERLVVDIETGLRGYLITDRPLFLQPLYRAQASLPAAERALSRVAAVNRAHGHQSQELIAAVRSYLSSYVLPLLASARSDLAGARSLAVTLEGKQLVDGIRARTAALERAVSASQAARQREAHDAADRAITEAIVALVVLTLLTVALGFILGRLAVERDLARERSEATSETLQQSILPSALPAIPGCELAARFIPNSGLVGGDFYDAFRTGPDRWTLIIGDVSGKGAPAAALTAMARWTLRSLLESGSTPVEALRTLNAAMLGQDLDRRFVTVACVQLTEAGGRLDVRVACAGHPPPILVPAQGPPRALAAEGTLLGVLATIELRPVHAELAQGDAIVAYTDGVTDQGPEEGPSPEQALVNRPGGGDADSLADALRQLSEAYAGPYRDDIAILALRFVGSPAAEETESALQRSGAPSGSR
jgi:serine phosphatase RsbU (regulator of sigma subunit)